MRRSLVSIPKRCNRHSRGRRRGVREPAIAAAFSLYLSDQYPSKHFLAVSTDPAYSLPGTFGHPLSRRASLFRGRGSLRGSTVCDGRRFRSLREENGAALTEILERGTCLSTKEDLSRFVELSFPGLAEVISLTGIVALLDVARYGLALTYTATTSHAPQLLNLPVVMRRWTSSPGTLVAAYGLLDSEPPGLGTPAGKGRGACDLWRRLTMLPFACRADRVPTTRSRSATSLTGS